MSSDDSPPVFSQFENESEESLALIAWIARITVK